MQCLLPKIRIIVTCIFMRDSRCSCMVPVLRLTTHSIQGCAIPEARWGSAEGGCRAGARMRERLPGGVQQSSGALCGGGAVHYRVPCGRRCAGARQPRLLAGVRVRVQQAGQVLRLPDQLPALRLALADRRVSLHFCYCGPVAGHHMPRAFTPAKGSLCKAITPYHWIHN